MMKKYLENPSAVCIIGIVRRIPEEENINISSKLLF
jgi:hypothetical protein